MCRRAVFGDREQLMEERGLVRKYVLAFSTLITVGCFVNRRGSVDVLPSSASHPVYCKIAVCVVTLKANIMVSLLPHQECVTLSSCLLCCFILESI